MSREKRVKNRKKKSINIEKRVKKTERKRVKNRKKRLQKTERKE